MTRAYLVCLVLFSLYFSAQAAAVNGTDSPNTTPPSSSTTTAVPPAVTGNETSNSVPSINSTIVSTTTPVPATPQSKNSSTDSTTSINPNTTPINSTTSTTKAPPAKADNNLPQPAPPKAPEPAQARGFDGGSFVGGIILTLGLLTIGFMGYKYYQKRQRTNYNNF